VRETENIPLEMDWKQELAGWRLFPIKALAGMENAASACHSGENVCPEKMRVHLVS
jgi:hypothetical protein